MNFKPLSDIFDRFAHVYACVCARARAVDPHSIHGARAAHLGTSIFPVDAHTHTHKIEAMLDTTKKCVFALLVVRFNLRFSFLHPNFVIKLDGRLVFSLFFCSVSTLFGGEI
jgi:hypothetical protein